MNIDEVSSDTQKFADLILKAAEIPADKANIEMAETLGDIVVGCLLHAYQSMLTDPAAKTPQERKTMANTLMLIEAVTEAVDEMTSEFRIDNLAGNYVKKRKNFDAAKKKILQFMRVSEAENPEALDVLKKKLLEDGLDVSEWQELVVKSETTGWKKSDGESSANVLASLFSQMNDLYEPSKIAAGKLPLAEEVNLLMSRLEREVASITDDAEQKLDLLAKRLREEPDMSREATRTMLAEIGQEICQPLSAITCAIDIISGKALGPLTTHQEEMLNLAAESGARLQTLANKIIEISGMPQGTKPDIEILNGVYGR